MNKDFAVLQIFYISISRSLENSGMNRKPLFLCSNLQNSSAPKPLQNFSRPGREKNAKICKISGEKLVFSPQISYIILRWNAVNAVKLCKFTARLSGDLTKIHHNSPLKYVISPPLQGSEPLTSCMSSTSSSTAPSLTKFYYFLFEYKSNSLYFLQNMRGEFL